jgi:hypothetical protein
MPGERPDCIDGEFRVIDDLGKPTTEFSTTAKSSPNQRELESDDIFLPRFLEPLRTKIFQSMDDESLARFKLLFDEYDEYDEYFQRPEPRKWWQFWK